MVTIRILSSRMFPIIPHRRSKAPPSRVVFRGRHPVATEAAKGVVILWAIASAWLSTTGTLSAQQAEPRTGAVPSSVPSGTVRLERPVSRLPADAPVVIQDDPVAKERAEEKPTAPAPISLIEGVTTMAPDPAENPETRDREMVKKRNLDFKPSLEANEYLGSTLETRKDARTFVLTVPAPRGMILDRNGHSPGADQGGALRRHQLSHIEERQ